MTFLNAAQSLCAVFQSLPEASLPPAEEAYRVRFKPSPMGEGGWPQARLMRGKPLLTAAVPLISHAFA